MVVCHQTDRPTHGISGMSIPRDSKSRSRLIVSDAANNNLKSQSSFERAVSPPLTQRIPWLQRDAPHLLTKMPLPFDDLPHLIHPSLDRPYSPTQTASRSNQPFCHSTTFGQSDRQTERPTDGTDDKSAPTPAYMSNVNSSFSTVYVFLTAAATFRNPHTIVCHHGDLDRFTEHDPVRRGCD